MSRNELLNEAQKAGATTARGLSEFKKFTDEFSKVDLPKPLQHPTLSSYLIDSVLLIEVKKIKGSYYVAKENLADLQYVKNEANPSFVRLNNRNKWQGVKDFSIF